MEFLVKLENYFSLHHADDALRVSAAFSFLSGSACIHWIRKVQKEMRSHTVTWDGFKRRFLKAFGDPHARDKAQNLIFFDVQGTRSVTAWNRDFEKNLLDGGLDGDHVDKFALLHYKRGLNEDIRAFVTSRDPIPRSLDGWMTAALQGEVVIRGESLIKKATASVRHTTTTTSHERQPDRNPPNARSGYVIPKFRSLDPALQAKLCIRCRGDDGHRADGCTVPREGLYNVQVAHHKRYDGTDAAPTTASATPPGPSVTPTPAPSAPDF